MTLAATFLGGAKSRLLPPSLPFRFFVAAAALHIALWVVLLVAGEEATSFRGGLGPPLAAVDLLTLGVLTTTAIGARLGLSFVLVRAAWGCLPLTLLIGLAALHDWAGPNGATLFGLALLGGWLMSFLFGILQRIMPFLASMHVTQPRGAPPLLSELAAEGPLTVHAVCHGLAIIGLAAAIILDNGWLVRGAAAVGLIGALAFALFTGGMVRRLASRRTQ